MDLVAIARIIGNGRLRSEDALFRLVNESFSCRIKCGRYYKLIS